MDKGTQQRLDDILGDEIARGFRVTEVPKSLQEQLAMYDLPPIQWVRFSKLNPGRKRRIGELVQKAYHRDMQDESILSEAEIARIAEQRGTWSAADTERMEELQVEVHRTQLELYREGAGTDDWYGEYMDQADQFRDFVTAAYHEEDPEKEKEVLEIFERWVGYQPERVQFYSEQYAASQGLTTYSPDRDMLWLYDHCPHPAAGECLNALEDVRDKLVRFIELRRKQVDWATLRDKHARVFSECVESRRDNTEALARVYHCCERVDEKGKYLGPLTKTFDDLWELPEDLVQWFLLETYFFLNGRTKEDREYFEAIGFPIAAREKSEATSETTESEPSVASPDPQTSKGDLTLLMETAAESSESAPPSN